MNLHQKITNSPGYAIIPIEDMKTFKKLRNAFIKKMKDSNKSNKNFDELRKKMVGMSNIEINKTMVNLLSFSNASEMMVNSCRGVI